MGSDTLTYAVSHHTMLRYSQAVAPSYNEVRMRPRDRSGQRTLAFALVTTPRAVPRARVDFFGNTVHRIDVGDPHDTLGLAVETVVETTPSRRRTTPRPWSPELLERDARLEFILASPRVPLDPSTAALRRQWTGEDRSFDALVALATWIPRAFRYVTGATTVDSSIDELLSGGAGVCQDFTHLFLAMARHAGWPARYVSGYLGPTAEHETSAGASHAWAEICGADGTWIALDPTHGGLAGPNHIRLAVGRDYSDVAPHRGVFYGDAVAEPPEVSVKVTRMSERAARTAERGAALHWQQQQQQQESGPERS
jgi:transglutaminase-like putative cysteine protease